MTNTVKISFIYIKTFSVNFEGCKFVSALNFLNAFL